MARKSKSPESAPPLPAAGGGYEVPEPILNSPYEEPSAYWFMQEGESARRMEGRRLSVVFPPRDQRIPWNMSDGTLAESKTYRGGFELPLVNRIRDRVRKWREAGYPGATRVTLDLLRHWTRPDRDRRLFFAQIEAAQTVIFMKEARPDALQGLRIEREPLGEEARQNGFQGFDRLACKMATGSGKTTVMGMLAAWSILNKLESPGDSRYSDAVLMVCPNVTIRDRLAELDPGRGDASLYRTRDLVPAHLMARLSQGRVLITNWHAFQPRSLQSAGTKVERRGVMRRVRETVRIGKKNDTKRGTRYLTEETLRQQQGAGMLEILNEYRGKDGALEKVEIESVQYIESDTALVGRVLGAEIGNKGNLLVFNDEAHHAYRIRPDNKDEDGDDDEEEEAAEQAQEATVWMDGLDKIQKVRGINFCVDLSATPYFLSRVGQDTNRPFPWVVSDFGLIDAIESGLVKVPQLVTRDTTGAEIPSYFNIWRWILDQLTPAERGPKKGSPKPEAILKYAHTPIAILGGLWADLSREWQKIKDDPRPPVFIVVCKNTAIAKVMYEWLGEGKQPENIPRAGIDGFLNREGRINTIRVDSKVVNETDSGEAKDDEKRWMRLTLDTVGHRDWPRDRMGRAVHPEGFVALAEKLKRPLDPPGRDIRCIVSVGMLTEGWDCNTVTHIVGLRPFMSQLLCEQVVGRGLRRTNYEVGEDGRLTEEVAKVFGVPFEVIPFKASPAGVAPPPVKRHHIRALPEKRQFAITYPRVEGYMQAVRNRVTVDWANVPPLRIEPGRFPPEADMKGLSLNSEGRLSLVGPGRLDQVSLENYRKAQRVQKLAFDIATGLTRRYAGQASAPAHVLFPQFLRIIQRYVEEKVVVVPPSDIKDICLAPYYGWLVEILVHAIRPDQEQGEAPEVPMYEQNREPGSTEDVDLWTSRDVREVLRCHLNYAVSDTKRWEQTAAYYIDKHDRVEAWVRNDGLGFAIPYFHNGQDHEYRPDFIIRLTDGTHLILETKGYDPLAEVKQAAAQRWVAAVNADGKFGKWSYAMIKKAEDVNGALRA